MVSKQNIQRHERSLVQAGKENTHTQKYPKQTKTPTPKTNGEKEKKTCHCSC